jgi:hypothetical protein
MYMSLAPYILTLGIANQWNTYFQAHRMGILLMSQCYYYHGEWCLGHCRNDHWHAFTCVSSFPGYVCYICMYMHLIVWKSGKLCICRHITIPTVSWPPALYTPYMMYESSHLNISLSLYMSPNQEKCANELNTAGLYASWSPY